MINFDLECLEMCGQLALEEKDKSESSCDEESECETNTNEKPDVELLSEMKSLKIEENPRPKIIELD